MDQQGERVPHRVAGHLVHLDQLGLGRQPPCPTPSAAACSRTTTPPHPQPVILHSMVIMHARTARFTSDFFADHDRRPTPHQDALIAAGSGHARRRPHDRGHVDGVQPGS